MINEELTNRVESALENVRPFLKADGGDVEIVEVSDEVVKLKLLGTCETCHMSSMTLKAGIEDSIKKAIPQIKEVIAVNV